MYSGIPEDEILECTIGQAELPGAGDYIENHLTRFVHILRHLSMRISSAEYIDALNALALVDMLDRKQVETALLATLAKSPEDGAILDKAFKAYFVTPEQKAERSAKYKQIQEQEAQEIKAVEDEMKYELEEPGDGDAREVTVPLSEEEKKIYTKLPEEKKAKLRDYMKKTFQGNPVNDPQELINYMIKSSLNYWKYYLKFQGDGPPEVEYTGDEDTDEILREVVDSLRDEEQLLYRDIQNITETDMPTAAALIAKLSRQLAARISRRYRRSKKRQRLDLRRTIRYNIRYGGTMFNLKYKTKRVDKPKILLICDVSGSMAKYAGFILQFIYGLSGVAEEIESFIFSEHVERITDRFNNVHSFEKTMADIINLSEEWGRGTDFHRALQEITGKHRNLLTKDTFVIIVSDTRTLNAEKAAAGLRDLGKTVKDIVWLNTLPKKVWQDTKSVSVFRRYCKMFECSTLAHLDKIMRTQMLR